MFFKKRTMFLIFIMMNLIDIAGCAISTRVYIDLPTWALVTFSNKIKLKKIYRNTQPILRVESASINVFAVMVKAC